MALTRAQQDARQQLVLVRLTGTRQLSTSTCSCARSVLPAGAMADEEEPEYDIAINVHKGAEGYGIYFTQLSDNRIQVTKLDCGSEAERSGVRANDFLHSVEMQHPRHLHLCVFRTSPL